MTVCYFGSFNREYSRNRIFIDGLQKNGARVVECASKRGLFLTRYPELFAKYWKVKDQVDVIFVGFVGHLDMPIAWLLARLTQKKVVFDMFFSMYDTYVFDRQSVRADSPRAKIYFWIDKLAATLADEIITDTKAHARYFIRTFGLDRKKFHRIFVGGDDTIFLPIKRHRSKNIIVEFHGMFTRLHGAEYFVEAAKLLENKKNIKFLLIGSTSNYFLPLSRYEELKPKTLTYLPGLPVRELAKKVAISHISVGHIGITEKARSVITNKMFHALNCGSALIAGDCSASRELLTDKKNALFVKMGDAEDLARKILLLAKKTSLRKSIAKEGRELAETRLNNMQLGKELLKVLS